MLEINYQRLGHLLCCLAIFSCLVSCSNKSSSYFPLQTGISWEYKAILKTMDSQENQKYIIANIVGKKIDGEEISIQKNLTGSEYMYAEDDSGIFQLGYIRGDDVERTYVENKRYLIQYPLTAGAEWKDTITTIALKNGGPRGVVITEEVPVRVVLEAVDDKVRVAAGTFRQCLRIVRTGEIVIPLGKYQYISETKITVKETSWYAPGVGLVKSVRAEETQSRLLDHGEHQMELFSYSEK